MEKEGEILAKYLADSRISAPKLAKLLGVSPQAVYKQLSEPRLADSFVEKLNSKGIDVFKGNNLPSIKLEPEALSILAAKDQVIKAKDDLIAAQAERIKAQEEGIKQLLGTIKAVEENTFNQIERVEEYVVNLDARISEFIKSVKNQKVRA